MNKSNLHKNNSIQEKNTSKNNEPIKNTNDIDVDSINILGIKLYLDDLIILFIIFILYKDNSTDNGLIICLLLLLLS
ncbi:MAG: hypothetical protein ACLSW4_07270 [Clostridia bacterium]